ncbi:hypothetical protein ABD74_20780 [Brevibacillus laterosporus]|nr:hypothetical protein [Brevibacillus laterosporus]
MAGLALYGGVYWRGHCNAREKVWSLDNGRIRKMYHNNDLTMKNKVACIICFKNGMRDRSKEKEN